jgi:hypothetical protein
MKTTNVSKVVQDFFHEDFSEIRDLVNAANADLYNGDDSSLDYPGFESACKQIKFGLKQMGAKRRIWVDTSTNEVHTREPWVEDDSSRFVVVEDSTAYLVGRELASYV